MWEESQGWDILERAPDVKVPCYFISGGNDFNTPAVLVDEMLIQPTAPLSARHYIIKEAAHTPFFKPASAQIKLPAFMKISIAMTRSCTKIHIFGANKNNMVQSAPYARLNKLSHSKYRKLLG